MRGSPNLRQVGRPDLLTVEQSARIGYDPADPEPELLSPGTPVVIENALEMNGRRVTRPKIKSEIVHSAWASRLRLRRELHALHESLQADLTEVSTKRAQAAKRRERAATERDAGRPQHAKRIDAEADDLEYRAESREARAEVTRQEIRRVQSELKAAGGRKVGSWLARGDVEDPPRVDHDPSASVH